MRRGHRRIEFNTRGCRGHLDGGGDPESGRIAQFTINISHRKLLEGLARGAGVPADLAPTVYRAVDKLSRNGLGGVRSELVEAGVAGDAADRLLALISQTGENQELIEALRENAGDDPEVVQALENLGELFDLLEDLAPGERNFRLDLTLARGLDYYTGIVYEATVDQPKVGSVSGGGRYDGLVGMFSGRDIPAMGMSIGLERIIEVAEEFQLVSAPASVCDAIVISTTTRSDTPVGWHGNFAKTNSTSISRCSAARASATSSSTPIAAAFHSRS